MGSRSCEGLLVIWTRKVEFFISGAHPKLVRSDWILVETFFFLEITKIWLKKPFQFWWRPFFWRSPDFDRKTASIWFKTDEIWVKFVYCCFHLSKKPPPPLRNPGLAPDIFCVLIFCHLIASEANCLKMHKSFLAITTSWLEETVTYMLKSEDFFKFLSTEFAACLKLPSRDKSL